MKKIIMVDMSATLIHHGHIRLIKKARKYGNLFIALTTDKQIKKYKGYLPELNFRFRKEILLEVKGVKKVVPSNWLITQEFLDKHRVDIIISGSDYNKRKFKTRSINFKRTKFISSITLRKKAMKIFKKNYEK
jgi:glycerol-3-phosphate cytidylyltransferase